ncbi:hypothetical protein BST61_g11023 [Cercospora zeina]
MTCGLTACGTEYCFMCGDKAKEREGHWDVGKPCPKYNHPGDGNAIYEDPEEEDDFDDMFVEAQIDEDIHNLNMRLQMDLQNDVGLNRGRTLPPFPLGHNASCTRLDDRPLAANFPGFLEVVNRWELAVAGAEGWQVEFRRQLEALRAAHMNQTASSKPSHSTSIFVIPLHFLIRNLTPPRSS